MIICWDKLMKILNFLSNLQWIILNNPKHSSNYCSIQLYFMQKCFCKVMLEVLFLWILSINLYNLAWYVIYVFLFVHSFCGIRILCDQLHLLAAIFLMWCSPHILLDMYWELHQEIHSSITGKKNNQPQWNRQPELMAGSKPNCVVWSRNESLGVKFM